MALFGFFHYICNVRYIFFEKILEHNLLPAIFFEKIDNFAKHFLSYIQEKESASDSFIRYGSNGYNNFKIFRFALSITSVFRDAR